MKKTSNFSTDEYFGKFAARTLGTNTSTDGEQIHPLDDEENMSIPNGMYNTSPERKTKVSENDYERYFEYHNRRTQLLKVVIYSAMVFES